MPAYRPKEKILTAGELCQWWQITNDQLEKLRRKKNLPYVELARGSYIFSEKELAKWVNENRTIFNGSDT